MVSFPKAQFFNNNNNNNNKNNIVKINHIISAKICHENDAIYSPFSRSYYYPLGPHGCTRLPCPGLRAIHQRCNMSLSHKSRDNQVRLSLRIPHRRCVIWYVLALKHHAKLISRKTCLKPALSVSYYFSHKTCQLTKPDIEMSFINL